MCECLWFHLSTMQPKRFDSVSRRICKALDSQPAAAAILPSSQVGEAAYCYALRRHSRGKHAPFASMSRHLELLTTLCPGQRTNKSVAGEIFAKILFR